MKISTRVALALGFLLGLAGQTFGDGRGFPRGGGGASKTNVGGSSAAVTGATGKFDVLDAGVFNDEGPVMLCRASATCDTKVNGTLSFPNQLDVRNAAGQTVISTPGGTTLQCGADLGSWDHCQQYRTTQGGFGFLAETTSGNYAFRATTNGARFDFGAGASDYASSDGTTVTFAGPVVASTLASASQISVTSGGAYISSGQGTTGISFGCGNNTGDICLIRSNVGSGAATSSVPALLFRHDNGALDSTDLLVDFRDNTTVSKFKVDASGNATAAGSVTANSRLVPTSAPHDGGTPQVYMEYGRVVLSSGTATLVFKNAFSVIPQCFCQDGTAIAACDIPVGTISTSQFVVNGTTTDTIMWHCVGDR